MSTALDGLRQGVRRFRQSVYPEKAENFRRLESEPQRPHTLFITCADSRVDPVAVTQAGLGEIFVTRNIGNMVPPYGEVPGSMGAVIEYAVKALKVQHVAICGHSDCGAMKALLNPNSTETMPAVSKWLTYARAAQGIAQGIQTRSEWRRDALSLLTEQNVLQQLQHLRTHPSVARALALGDLTLSGWVYDIGRGEVRIAEDDAQAFTPVDVLTGAER